MKKSPLKKLEDKLWELCRALTFLIHGNNCYTCSQRNLHKQNRQCGHYFPKGALGAAMKYDLRILRPQCYNCNINYGGMGAVFRENMRHEIGKAAEQKLYLECTASKGKPIKALPHYQRLVVEYTSQFKQLCPSPYTVAGFLAKSVAIYN